MDIDADNNRTGPVEGSALEETCEGEQSALVLVNCDNDGGPGRDCDDVVINGAGDVADLADLVLRRAGPVPADWRVLVRIDQDKRDKIRIFDKKHPVDGVAVIGGTAGGPADQYAVPAPFAADLVYGVEGCRFPGDPDAQFDGVVSVTLALQRPLGGGAFADVATDTVFLQNAPFLLLSNLQAPLEVYVSSDVAGDTTFRDGVVAAVAGSGASVVQVDFATYPDQWLQDEVEIGYTKAPYGQMHVVLNLPRNGGLDPWPANQSVYEKPN